MITNNSGGMKGFNRKTGEAANGLVPHETFYLAPGEEADFALADPANPVYRGWEVAGDVNFGGALEDAPKPVVVTKAAPKQTETLKLPEKPASDSK